MFEKSLPSSYGRFEPIVADIKAGVYNAEMVGEGRESKVWRVRLALGDYAIKIAKNNVLNVRGRVMDQGLMTKSAIESGLAARGIDGLEQLETGAVKDYAAVFQFVDGMRLTDFTEEAIDVVTAEHKEKIRQTVAEATKQGLVFDGRNPSGANAFYEPGKGFTLIDYARAWRPISYEENWDYAVRSLGPVAMRLFSN